MHANDRLVADLGGGAGPELLVVGELLALLLGDVLELLPIGVARVGPGTDMVAGCAMEQLCRTKDQSTGICMVWWIRGLLD